MYTLHWTVGFLSIALTLVTAGHALMFKRDPRASWGWIAVCLLFPLIGSLLYLLFGINRVQTRAKRLTHRLPFFHPFTTDRPEIPLKAHPQADLAFEDRRIAAVSDKVARRPLVGGNRVEALHNGEEAYPAMLEAIEGAKRYVYLATYILDSNRTGRQFVDALARARHRGVEVRVLLDGIGELYSFPRSGRLLKKQGVRVARFLPPRLMPPSIHVNLRSHRKILVADGGIGFVGGMNIGDRHLAGAEDNPSRVVDLHFRVAGPVVGQIEEVFLEDWAFATGEDEAPDPGTPIPEGNAVCRAIVDGPGEDLDSLAMILVGAVSAAQRQVLIVTPYFLPSREMIGALQAAALRGIEVTVLLPSKNNLPFVHWAARNMLWELLQWGIRIYYQPPPFVHTKLFLVDGRYAQIGSANLDPRSLRLNFELAVEVFDAEVAGDLAAHVFRCRNRSREILLDEVDGRSFPAKLRDSMAWLFSPYL
ncbi:MAG: cardiolipin synthase [Desulfobacteraceae bacterium]|jgi:cardiolipin synthase